LGLLRIGTAFILLLDLLIRFSDITAFYTDEGALRRNLLTLFPANTFISFHTLSGELSFQVLLFAIAFLAALGLLAGLFTRSMTIISWLLLVSIHNRNPMVLQGGDELLRMLLLWGIFLPWGKKYSIAARHNKSGYNMRDNEYRSFAVLGYILLLFSMYFFSGLSKNSPEWKQGLALYYAFNLDMMVFPVGKFLLQYPDFLKLLTRSVLYTEMILPFLLLIPFKRDFFRGLFIIAFTLFHLTIALTLFVGLYPLIGIVSLLGLLPGRVIDKLERNLPFLKSKYLFENPSEASIGKSGTFIPGTYLLDSLMLFLITYSFAWNMTAVWYFPYKLEGWAKKPAALLRLDQNWTMFAPNVYKNDGWFVFEGFTKSEDAIDIRRNGQPVNYNKPLSEVSLYKNDRWRKFLENYVNTDNMTLRQALCSFLIKDWNGHHPNSSIDSLSIIFFKESSVSPGESPVVIRQVLCATNNKSVAHSDHIFEGGN
jgi:hypothetical protein